MMAIIIINILLFIENLKKICQLSFHLSLVQIKLVEFETWKNSFPLQKVLILIKNYMDSNCQSIYFSVLFLPDSEFDKMYPILAFLHLGLYKSNSIDGNDKQILILALK